MSKMVRRMRNRRMGGGRREYRRMGQGRREWIVRHEKLGVQRREEEETKGGEGDREGDRDHCSHQHDHRV